MSAARTYSCGNESAPPCIKCASSAARACGASRGHVSVLEMCSANTSAFGSRVQMDPCPHNCSGKLACTRTEARTRPLRVIGSGSSAIVAACAFTARRHASVCGPNRSVSCGGVKRSAVRRGTEHCLMHVQGTVLDAVFLRGTVLHATLLLQLSHTSSACASIPSASSFCACVIAARLLLLVWCCNLSRAVKRATACSRPVSAAPHSLAALPVTPASVGSKVWMAHVCMQCHTSVSHPESWGRVLEAFQHY